MRTKPTDTLLKEAFVSLRHEHNDLRIVAGADVDPAGFTLLAVLKNEMYFLPAFLNHYRELGVQRFVFLNDRSDDGSFEYLVEQPDTVVVEGGHSYSDIIKAPQTSDDTTDPVFRQRMLYAWRGMLHDMFALDRWALHVDLDEFVRLPEGLTFPGFAGRLDGQTARAIWGVMLDVYPRDVAALAEQRLHPHLDQTAVWYFDAEPHLRLKPGRSPRQVYPGARARLLQQYHLDKLYPELWSRERRRVWRGWRFARPARFNLLQKPVLIKWSIDDYFEGSHVLSCPASADILLPVQHFRFSGGLYSKIRTASRGTSHTIVGSTHYPLLSELLRKMEEHNGTFIYRNSLPLRSFSDLSRSGNAFGL